MTKLFLFVAVTVSLNFGTPSIIRADSEPGSNESVNTKTWKEMQRVSGIIAAEMETHRKDGTNPVAFFAPAETTPSYRLIAIAVYGNPKTLEEAKTAAKRGNTLNIDVLAKALLEYNRRAGINDPLVCLAASCRKRQVEIALTQQGLGIHDAPIKRDINYSTRLISP
jgi:hypothetical protein